MNLQLTRANSPQSLLSQSLRPHRAAIEQALLEVKAVGQGSLVPPFSKEVASLE
ncbi:MAG: hypothetical protein JO235_09980 [Chroococcidiopsidaceae cyanobacterium CP_BM_RX_35]|nr:hypothetical protein [Chroococcidiopsidaceae cyanobacterium CP_BM_RX_35]